MNTEKMKQPGKQLVARLCREPLVHFVLLALVIFLINALGGNDDKDVIVIDAATQQYLFNREKELVLRELSDDEKQALIDSFIEDEILVREAQKRGFTNSSRIRTLLIQNMRYFLKKDLSPPTEKELITFYNNNIELFKTPAAISYDQVFFKDPDAIPSKILQKLNAGADFKSIGDKGLFGSLRLVKATERDISSAFGPANAKKILSINDTSWHGPFVSQYGAHFLRISERHEPMIPRFEDVSEWVVKYWDIYKNRQNLDHDMTEIRKNYRVEIESLNGEV